MLADPTIECAQQKSLRFVLHPAGPSLGDEAIEVHGKPAHERVGCAHQSITGSGHSTATCHKRE